MKSPVLVAVAVTVGFASASALGAPKWKCDAERLVGEPVLTNGVLKGSMVADCVITEATGGGLPALERFLMDYATRVNVQSVNAGPLSVEYAGMPATQYEVVTKDPESDMVIRQKNTIAYARGNHLVYAGDSLEIRATGLAANLKRMDSRMDFTTTAVKGTFKLRFMAGIQISKPGVVPGGVFKNLVMKNARKRFVENLNRVVPEVIAEL